MSEDRQYMGTAADAKSALIEKAKAWRETRQPSMDTAAGHRERDSVEREQRFQLANAALLWLWHEENPDQSARLPSLVDREAVALDIRSLSQSTKDGRCLEVWFAKNVTDADRGALLQAVNALNLSGTTAERGAGRAISEAQLSEGVKWIDWDGALNLHDEMRQLRKACEQMFGLQLPSDCPDNLAEEISTIIHQCKGLIGAEHAKAIYSVIVKYAAALKDSHP